MGTGRGYILERDYIYVVFLGKYERKKEKAMKKKIVVITIVCLSIVSFAACSREPERPENISEGMYDIGVKAVKITDRYLDADLTLDEAYDEISNLSSQASSSISDEYNFDVVVSIDIGSIEYDLFSMRNPYGDKKTDSDVKNDRNELMDTLGL